MFSPTRFGAPPGMPFGGDLDRYPHPCEVVTHLPHPAGLDGALDPDGHPHNRGGASPAHPGLAFVGLEWQRSLPSDTLHGVGRSAARTARPLASHLTRSRPPALLVRCVST
ncbi:hypothetical protein ACIPWI_22080 [Streptomyces sp. NPDC090046]|uniref:hypothetical protein n=1 Tax=Streptomyces sp. NPDC090046 TaxID=3365928 RepID=UPI00380C4020